jgi:diguanylate cyclase (GGDEF)-like protein
VAGRAALGEGVVARQGGLGRGLAALLPTEGHEHGHLHFVAPPSGEGAGAMAEFSAQLMAALAASQSGLSLIYRALDGLVSQFELRDAAVVLDEPGLARQVFCAGRRPLDEDEEQELLSAEPGLYTDPPLDPRRFDPSMLTSLCTVALRLDLLRYDSWHDPLTALYDRRSFDRLLEMAVARSSRYNWAFSLVLLDLDELKRLNDTRGHQAGDEALRALGERLRHVLRYGDNAARIGGDEFALILPNTDPEDVPALLERVAAPQEGEAAIPAFSYGIATCPADAEDADTLVRIADQRLYEAKEGRS